MIKNVLFMIGDRAADDLHPLPARLHKPAVWLSVGGAGGPPQVRVLSALSAASPALPAADWSQTRFSAQPALLFGSWTHKVRKQSIYL